MMRSEVKWLIIIFLECKIFFLLNLIFKKSFYIFGKSGEGLMENWFCVKAENSHRTEWVNRKGNPHRTEWVNRIGNPTVLNGLIE